VIDYDEYVAAGFTEAQARLLTARDRRQEERTMQLFGLLQDAVNKGFVNLTAQMEAGFANLNRRLTEQGHAIADIHRTLVDHGERLDRIEEHLKRPGSNGGSQP